MTNTNPKPYKYHNEWIIATITRLVSGLWGLEISGKLGGLSYVFSEKFDRKRDALETVVDLYGEVIRTGKSGIRG